MESDQDAKMDILRTLKSKFFPYIDVINQSNFYYVMHQLKLAHWHLLDNYIKKDLAAQKMFPKRKFESFIETCLTGLKIDKALDYDMKDMVGYYNDHRHSLPCFGAILLNSSLTEIVLVKGQKDKSWTFPRGKIEYHEDENEVQCAIREVQEEVGIDISNLINPSNKIQKRVWKANSYSKDPAAKPEKIYHKVTLYIIPNVDKTIVDELRTTDEIKHVKWWNLDDLHENDYKNFRFVKQFLSELKMKKDLFFPSI